MSSPGVRAWRPYRVVACAVCLLQGEAWSQLAYTNADSNALTEQFKAFIAFPPIIKNLMFQRKVPIGGGARPLDGSFAYSTSFEYFEARRQTNGLLFRRLNSPANAADRSVAGQMVSWAGHQHALVEPRPLLTVWDDRDPSVAGKSNSVFYTSQFYLDPLREILNLGVMHIDIGVIRWEGNRFRTESVLDREPLSVSGTLVLDGQGLPMCLNVSYASPHKTYDYVIRYGGWRSGFKCPFLPTAITNFWLRKDARGIQTEMDLDEWRILDIDVGNAPLSPEAFDVGPFALQNQWPTQIYTNGGFYAKSTNATLQFIEMLEDNKANHRPPKGAELAAFYASWGGINLAIFALMLGARERKTTKNKERTEKS